MHIDLSNNEQQRALEFGGTDGVAIVPYDALKECVIFIDGRTE